LRWDAAAVANLDIGALQRRALTGRPAWIGVVGGDDFGDENLMTAGAFGLRLRISNTVCYRLSIRMMMQVASPIRHLLLVYCCCRRKNKKKKKKCMMLTSDRWLVRVFDLFYSRGVFWLLFGN
jgi:hypothetical protein